MLLICYLHTFQGKKTKEYSIIYSSHELKKKYINPKKHYIFRGIVIFVHSFICSFNFLIYVLQTTHSMLRSVWCLMFYIYRCQTNVDHIRLHSFSFILLREKIDRHSSILSLLIYCFLWVCLRCKIDSHCFVCIYFRRMLIENDF